MTVLTTIVRSERSAYSVENFGFMLAFESPRELAELKALRPKLNLDESTVVEMDPNDIRYTCNDSIIHEALTHYIHSEDLFDNEGWFGNLHPVVVAWKGSHVVLDGNHRVTAARMAERTVKVLLTP